MDTQKLRQRILDLAIRGKLVPQDPNDEPASVLLDRIRAEKERLIAEGKIKRPKAKKSTDKSHYQQFTPPFDIPESWQWVTIADICSKIGSGSTPKGSNYSFDGIPFFRSQNVYNEGLVYADIKYISEEIHQSMIGTEVNAGDLLLNITGGSLGRCAVVPEDFAKGNVSQHVCILRPIFVHPKYFHCFILSSDFAKAMNLTGSGREGLPKYNLEVMNFPLPPIKEQERIVATIQIFQDILNLLDSSRVSLIDGITKAKSKILDLAMQGKLVPQDPADEPAADLLRRINPKAKIIADNPHYPQLPDNWVMTTIESVCNYGYSETVNVDDIDSSDWVLELEDLEKDSGRIISLKSKTERTINGVRHRFTIGDVLYSKLRTYLNKVLVAPEDGYCTTEIIPVRSYDCVIPEYLCAWLRSPFFLSYTIECCYGVKMPRLSTSDARKGVIPLPPIPEQKRIVQKLNKISTSFEILSNSIG